MLSISYQSVGPLWRTGLADARRTSLSAIDNAARIGEVCDLVVIFRAVLMGAGDGADRLHSWDRQLKGAENLQAGAVCGAANGDQ